MEVILLSPRYLSSNSWQKGKKDGSGRQSSSRMMASSNKEKTQSKPLITRSWHPRLFSEKFWKTSQGQSTRDTIWRTCWQASASPCLLCLGPSAMSSSFVGRTLTITSNTLRVVSGRLKTNSATGVSNFFVCMDLGGKPEPLSSSPLAVVYRLRERANPVRKGDQGILSARELQLFRTVRVMQRKRMAIRLTSHHPNFKETDFVHVKNWRTPIGAIR